MDKKQNIKYNPKTGGYDVVMKKGNAIKIMERTIDRPLTKKAERKIKSGKWKKEVIKSPGSDQINVYKGNKKQLNSIPQTSDYYDFGRTKTPVKETMRSKVQWYKGIDKSFGYKPSKRSAYVKFIKGKTNSY